MLKYRVTACGRLWQEAISDVASNREGFRDETMHGDEAKISGAFEVNPMDLT